MAIKESKFVWDETIGLSEDGAKLVRSIADFKAGNLGDLASDARKVFDLAGMPEEFDQLLNETSGGSLSAALEKFRVGLFNAAKNLSVQVSPDKSQLSLFKALDAKILELLGHKYENHSART